MLNRPIFYLLLIFSISIQAAEISRQKVWIYIDESQLSDADFTSYNLSSRATNRILKNLGQNNIPEIVPAEHIRAEILQYADEVLFYSRSIKAYSAFVLESNQPYLNDLPYVKEIVPVRIYQREAEPEPELKLKKTSTTAVGIYGNTYQQLQMLNIPAVHDSGYTGAGVRIAIIDGGFYKEHSAFQQIINDGRLIAERDFIYKDNDVQDDEAGDTVLSSQIRHGTSVWSVIGGYVPNVFVGAAFGAEFLLAKSEIIATETILEEDLFVSAVEWADEKGADIISSSVAYRDFNFGIGDYFFEDLDGKTTNATKAINWAFERGILSVICAGNEAKLFPADGGLLTPADAYGAIAIGAVDIDRDIASFSSHGPTYDGRIKPELCALGVDTYIASSHTNNSYTFGDGTSYSTPLIAGAAALLMEKYPAYPPVKIIELLKEHASLSDKPNNIYGWGIPNIFDAMFEADTSGILSWNPEKKRIYALPNPAVSGTTFSFRWTHVIPGKNSTQLNVYNLLGELVWSKNIMPKVTGNDENIYWDLKNIYGSNISSGVYFVTLKDGNTTYRGKCLVLH